MAKAELSEEQVEELRQAFDMFDRDKGGSISTRELGYTMRAMGMNPTEAEILDLLCEVRLAWLVSSLRSDHKLLLLLQFDSDNNGSIEFSEFCLMMSGRMLVVHDLDTVKMAFRALDESGSGFISYKQLKYLITNIGKEISICLSRGVTPSLPSHYSNPQVTS